MRLLIMVSILLTASIPGMTQSCNCDSIFSQVKNTVEANYAGWEDKVTSANLSIYQDWTRKFQLRTTQTSSDSACYSLLNEWVSFFKDKHLGLRYTQARKGGRGTNSPDTPITILKTASSETELRNYLATNKNLEEMEGIYKSASYELAVTKVKQDLFHATVLSSSNENWKPGEVKLLVSKQAGSYKGTFIDGDKSGSSEHAVKLVDNILDFDIIFFEKTFPQPVKRRDIREYEIMADNQAPHLRFDKNNVAVFTFPNFYGDSYDQLQYLLEKYAEELKTTPYWVIDLRENDGGDYMVGMQLLPYIYSNPIVEYNSEMRMSEENYQRWYNSYVRETYESSDSTTKKSFDSLFAVMLASKGRMFNRSGKIADTITMDRISDFPKKIAILVNEGTVSSGELFTILARQSKKVKVMGTRTGGMMDYGNVITYPTACPAIRLRLPMNRQLWLDAGISVDKEGLTPDVTLKEKDMLEQAISRMMLETAWK